MHALVKRKKIWEECNVRNQLVGHIQQDYLEAQVTQLRKRLLKAEIKIEYWKGTFKTFEINLNNLKSVWQGLM